MKTGIKVGDIMTRNLTYVSLETNLLECAKIMIKERVGGLVIKDGEKLNGIITEKDLIWALTKKSKSDLKDILAKDIMKRKVVTIKPSEDIADAMRKFKKKKVRRLPVVEKKKLIGIITIKDIIKIDPGLIQMIIETVKIQEETEKLKRTDAIPSKEGGVCERCGNFDILSNVGAQFICEECYNKRML